MACEAVLLWKCQVQLKVDFHFHGGAYAHFACDVEFVDILLHVWQTHACSEAHVADFWPCGGVALLHGKRNIRYARTLVGHDHFDFVGVYVDKDLAAVGMRNGIDLGFVKCHYHALYDGRFDVELFEGFLDRAGGFSGVDKIAFDNGVFLVHFDSILRLDIVVLSVEGFDSGLVEQAAGLEHGI